MSITDLIEMATNEQLSFQLNSANEELALHQKRVSEYQLILRDIQAELDRRALDAYWEAHPDLMRLEVGDKLLITQEFKNHKQDDVKQGNAYDLGDIYEVESMSIDSDDCNIRTNSSVTSCPLTIANNLRRAYLAQNPETEEGES